MDAERRAQELGAFERATAGPMLVLSLVLLLLIALPFLTEISSTETALVGALVGCIWIAFAVHLGVRVYLAPRRVRYLLAHWYDLVILLLPVLRPFRILLIVAVSRRTLASGFAVLTRHGLHYALLAAAALLTISAIAVRYFERNGDGDITSFGIALWWAAQTATSVGYGDAVPVTTAGRLVAALVMLVGVALFSVVTANVAAFLVEGGARRRASTTLDDVAAEVRRLEGQISALGEQIDRMASAAAGRSTAEGQEPPGEPPPAAGADDSTEAGTRGDGDRTKRR